MSSACELKTLVGHKGAILCCTIYQNNIITAGHDKKIVVWCALTGKVKLEIIGHEHMISDLDIYSSSLCKDPVNEAYVLSASWDNSVKVWNMRTGALISKFNGHKNRVRRVKALPDIANDSMVTSSGKYVQERVLARAVSGDDDGHLHVWNIATGDALIVLDEHSRFIVSLALYIDSAGQCCLASASADATIRLWELAPLPAAATVTAAASQLEGSSESKSVTAFKSAPSSNNRIPNRSSACAIRAPSKFISAMTVTTISANSALITGSAPRSNNNNNNNNKNSGHALSPLPSIPSPKRAKAAGAGSAVSGPEAPASDPAETIVLAGDTLGSIFLFRASTGVLLARLEAKCKIVDLLVSSCGNIPYFPPCEDVAGAGAVEAAPVSFDRGQAQFVSQERAVLLAQAAHMRRSNNILTKLVGAAVSDAVDAEKGLFLYYVPDNGSVGCFTLVSADAASPKTSPKNANSSGTDPVSAIVSSHTVSTALSERMSALSGSRNTPDGNKIRSFADSAESRNNSGDSGESREPPAPMSAIRKLSTITSASERNIATANTPSAVPKLRKSTTYSHDVAGGGLHSSGAGKDAVPGAGAKDMRGGEGNAASAVPSNGSNGNNSSNNPKVAGVTGVSGSSTGGVMSVSISAPSADLPLLQCCALSPGFRSAAVIALGGVHHVVFGARDGVLLYCRCNADAHPPTGDAHLPTSQQPASAPLASTSGDGPATKSPPTSSRTVGALPPLKAGLHRSGGSSGSSPVHISPAALSPAAKSASGENARSPSKRGGSWGGGEKETSHSIRKAALLSMFDDELDDEPDPSTGGGGQGPGPSTETASAAYHICRTDSEDPLDAPTHSEMSHIMHYYDDLVSSDAGGDAGPGAGVPARPRTLVEGLQVHFAELVTTGSALDGADIEGAAADGGQHAGSAGTSVHSADSASSEFASIVTNSTLNPQFWQAAHTAKSTYNFRRIRLQGKQPVSPSKASAMYQLSEASFGGASSSAYATGNYPGPGAGNSLSRNLLNSRQVPASGGASLQGSVSAAALPAGTAGNAGIPAELVAGMRPATTSVSPQRSPVRGGLAHAAAGTPLYSATPQNKNIARLSPL